MEKGIRFLIWKASGTGVDSLLRAGSVVARGGGGIIRCTTWLSAEGGVMREVRSGD